MKTTVSTEDRVYSFYRGIGAIDHEGFIGKNLWMDLFLHNAHLMADDEEIGIYEGITRDAFMFGWTRNEFPGSYLSDLQDLEQNGHLSFVPPATMPTVADHYTIYRGTENPRYRRGMAWTLDREKATWFANRFRGADARVHSTRVHLDQILAYTNDRNESEVIVRPLEVSKLRMKIVRD